MSDISEYTLGHFPIHHAAKKETLTIGRFLDIATLATGLLAYSRWLNRQGEMTDAHLQKGLATASRYSGQMKQGLETFIQPLLERSDASELKLSYRQALRPGKITGQAFEQGKQVPVMMGWLRKRQQVMRDLFSGKAYPIALKYSQITVDDSPETVLNKLAAIQSISGLRFPRKWNEEAAAKVGAPITDTESVMVDAVEAQQRISDLRDAQTALDNADPGSEEQAEAAAAKAVVTGKIEEIVTGSKDSSAVRAAVISAVSEQPVSEIGERMGLTPEQMEALVDDGKLVITAGAGSGKCVRADTLIQTYEGLIEIGSLTEGMNKDTDALCVKRIHGPFGPEETSHVYFNGLAATLCLRTSAGFELEATPNHRIYVLREGEIQWARIDEITVDDYVVIDRREGLFPSDPFVRQEVESRQGGFQGTKGGAENIPKTLTPQIAQLLGWIVSKGYVRSDQWSFSLSTADPEQAELYRASMQGLFEWQEHPDEGRHENQKTQEVFEVCRREVLETLMAFGLTRVGAHDKEIPAGILRSPKPIVREFLRTLWDGNGGVSGNVLEYPTTSDKLATQLHVLMLSFGVVARKRKKSTSSKHGYAWLLTVSGEAIRTFVEEIGFSLTHKQLDAQRLANRTSDTNVDVIPTVAGKCAAVFQRVKESQGTTFSTHPSYRAFKDYRKGRRRPSHDGLASFLHTYHLPGDVDWDALRALVGTWFFDPVVQIEDSFCTTADFVVPGSHAFSGGGFINHNTRVMAAKIAYCIQEKGYRPEQVMATSFTRKSAKELKTRVEEHFGIIDANIGTTHSISAQIIRSFRPQWQNALRAAMDGTTERLFTIAMAQVQLNPQARSRGGWGGRGRGRRYAATNLYKDALGQWFNLGQRILDNRGKPIGKKRLKNYIGKWKMGGWGPDQAWSFYQGRQVEFATPYFAAAVYGAYEYLKTQDPQFAPAFDFDDWLLKAVEILKQDPQALKAMQRRYKVVLVDEGQDLNNTQHQLFGMIAGQADTFAYVGDDKQCVEINTPVATPTGETKAGDLRPGDEILAYRNGSVLSQRVRHVVPSAWNVGVRICTSKGHSLTMSPNHKIWASEPQEPKIAVYLLYRPGSGFRVDLGKTSEGSSPFQERAERMWILDLCEDQDSAWEKAYRYVRRYGVPRGSFNYRKGEETVFDEFGKNGAQILDAKYLAFDLPHWVSQSCAVNLIAHSNQEEYGPTSQVWLDWKRDTPNEALMNLEPTFSTQTRHYFRRCFANYRKGLKFAQELAQRTGAALSEHLPTPEGPLPLITASGLFTGMRVAIPDGDGITLDTLVSVESVEGASFVDLDVDDASNFFGGGVLSHNSIYAFRGAVPEEFISLPEQGFKLKQLTMNFRSGQAIVDAANKLIAHNERQIPMVCSANVERKGMGQIRAIEEDTHEKAASRACSEIADSIKKGGMSPDDFGIVVRNNAEADAYALSLMARGIPFRTKVDFFSKPIIKAVLAWMTINSGGSDEEINDAIVAAHVTPGFFLDKQFGTWLGRRAGRGENYLDYLLGGGPVYDQEWRNRKMVAAYRDVVGEIAEFDGDTAQVIRRIMDIKGSKQSFEESLIEQIDADELAESLGREPSDEEIREAALVPIRPVMAVAENFQDPKKMMTFIHKLKRANSATRKTDEDPEPAVPIMTGHSWKGLEAKHIYISMAGGVFPPDEELMRRDEAPDPIIKAGTIEDERRLAYVAITRGEDSVTIMSPKENYRGIPAGRSQFIDEACIGIEGEVVPAEDDEAAEDSPPPGRTASSEPAPLSFPVILEGFFHGASWGDLNESDGSDESDEPVEPSSLETVWEFVP